MTYYHVVHEWDGKDLLSLSERLGSVDDAVAEFNRRWPEGDDNYDFAAHHVQYVHLHDTIDAARHFAHDFGGDILAIDIPDDCYDVDVITDGMEYPHPMVRYRIPANYITRL
jgi:hypothetical protein